MPLVVEGADAPMRADELRGALDARGELWLWVERSCASGRLLAGDAVEVVAPSRAFRGALSIVDDGGVATVAEPNDGRERLAVLRSIWRDRRQWSLDDEPWRTALSSGSIGAWRIAERLRAAVLPVVRSVEQLARTPALDEVEAVESTFYDTPDVVGSSERLTGGGLSSAEEAVATRVMKEGDRVLVVGCGTGRESLALARRGMRVAGIDISRTAIASARRSALDAGLTGASFETMSFPRMDVAHGSFDVVLVSSDVLCGIPGRTNRAEALSRARNAVREGGSVVVAASSGRGPARVLLEAPRAALRSLGFGAREVGDRFTWHGPPPTRRFHHAYGDDLEIARELEAGGLAYEGRIAGFVLARREHRAAVPARRTLDAAVEMARVLTVLPRVERARRTCGPGPLAAEMRRLAQTAPRRDPLGRASLRATIASCDRALPRGAGCYRRALLEMALDAGAADEALVLGFRRHGIGHAWVGTEATEESFDWIVRI
ncbi:MAG: hypothetical protein JWP87_3351 [Labilithrix sp.]|nr:hypothetical protein [Labilithrix sp.]